MKYELHGRLTDAQQDYNSAFDDGWDAAQEHFKDAVLKAFAAQTNVEAHKIGRILNGDPDYHDSWHDIIGYTKLVADTLHIDV